MNSTTINSPETNSKKSKSSTRHRKKSTKGNNLKYKRFSSSTQNDVNVGAVTLKNNFNESDDGIREIVKSLLDLSVVDSYSPCHQKGPDFIIPTEEIRCWTADGAIKQRKSSIDNLEFISVVTFLRRTVEKFPNSLALAVKRKGEWIKWSYQQYWNDVNLAAKGFIKLGLLPFQSVAILGFNAPEWVIANFGATFAGGFGTGIYITNSPEACFQVLDDCKARIVLVENEAQCKKIVQIRHRLPELKYIIQYIGQPNQNDILSWNEFLDIGCTLPDDILQRRIKGIAINQCCSIIYTSGTTGKPKGVMICHDSFITTAVKLNDILKIVPGEDKFVSYLPLSHVAAQIADIYLVVAGAGQLYFAPQEALRGRLVEFLREVDPTRVLGVPRVFEKMYEKLKEAEADMTLVKKAVFSWARGLGSSHQYNKINGSNAIPFLYPLAKRTILKKISQALGMENLISLASGAAPMSIEVIKYFLSLDILIMETYGLSECVAHSINIEGRIGSLGRPFPGFEVKIMNANRDGHGEICIRGRNLFMGYLGMESVTKESIDDEGWFRTGDLGFIDSDKFIYVTGRRKEIIITSGGKNVAPVHIESAVKLLLPGISHAVLIGDRRKFLSMILTLKCEIDPNSLLPLDVLDSVSLNWCRSIGSEASTVSEAIKDVKVLMAIQQGIDEVNEGAVSNVHKIQKWKLLPRDFSISTEELGPTLKMKRLVIEQKWKEVIDAFYSF